MEQDNVEVSNLHTDELFLRNCHFHDEDLELVLLLFSKQWQHTLMHFWLICSTCLPISATREKNKNQV